MDNFDLNLLRVFDALQRHGHLGKAAVELNLSQPAASYALKRLREELGDVTLPPFRESHNRGNYAARPC
jgi:DNA-binding transcriptional LysR family regulator